MSSLCFSCSTDHSKRSVAPMIVDNKVSYDNETFINQKTNIPERSSQIGMIFNNKLYKKDSSHNTIHKKQQSSYDADASVKDNDIKTHVPLASFKIIGKSKVLFKPIDKKGKYGEKYFSQERYLLKKKKQNFICENTKFIC